jgi:hypothetical protein
MHKNYISKYPDKSEILGNKVEDLKRNLRSHQAIVSKPINKAKVAIIGSYKITEILAKKKKKKKKKKPFEVCNVIKQWLVVAGDSLFDEFKNRTEICNATKEVQLSRNTITRRGECTSDDNEQKLRQDLDICGFFSLQLDEATDVCDIYQLRVFIWIVFIDGKIKELLKTRGEDIFQRFYASLLEINVPIHKLVSVTTDGAPAMTSKNVGLIGLYKKNPVFTDFFSCHCVIHQQTLYIQK